MKAESSSPGRYVYVVFSRLFPPQCINGNQQIALGTTSGDKMLVGNLVFHPGGVKILSVAT